MVIHPQSFRALAYEVQNHLSASASTDDSKLTLPLIEQELRHQYGIWLKDNDRITERMGAEPEPNRLQTVNITLTDSGDGDLVRRVGIAGVLIFGGKPYTQFVGVMNETSQRGFVPVDYAWQLKAMVDLTDQACFCFVGSDLVLRLTPDLVGLEAFQMTAVPADPFPLSGRGDDWYWKQAWFCTEEAKGKIKMQALRVFMGTHIQLQPRVDTKNNGLEG